MSGRERGTGRQDGLGALWTSCEGVALGGLPPMACLSRVSEKDKDMTNREVTLPPFVPFYQHGGVGLSHERKVGQVRRIFLNLFF